jgi:SAM-dependent methyltransferase
LILNRIRASVTRGAQISLRVDYDSVASTYDDRYKVGLYDGVLEALRALVRAKNPEKTLEVGCGTGYWLAALSGMSPHLYGLDYSPEMLRRALKRNSRAMLVRATAETLPYRDGTLDLIFCINAIHHFEAVGKFIAEAKRLLRPGGTLAVIGMDPHHRRDNWCVYDYFLETKATDLARYPSSGEITDMMLRAGFDRVECGVACRFTQTRSGSAVFDDPELQRLGCSQMALLTDEQYAAGIERIHSALCLSKPDQPPPVFRADIAMMLLCGSAAF